MKYFLVNFADSTSVIMKNILIFLSVFIISVVHSQNWTGAVNSDWNNSANWSAAPANGASVSIDPVNYIGNSVSPIILTNSTFSVSSMLLSNGAVLTINGNLTTTDDVEVLDANSEIIVNSGTFNVNVGNGGRLIADLGGAISVYGGIVNVGERLISGIDAQITILNGNVTTNERLLMDGGGKIIINDGYLTVGQVMALADGDLNGSSYFEQNGGTVNITGEVALENEAGNYQPTILITGGTFNLNGDLIWFGSAPGSGTPRVITTGGIVNINGVISNLPLSTVDMMFDIKNTSEVNFNGTSIDLVNVTDSIKLSGTSILKLSGIHNWNNEGVLQALDGLVICDGTTNLQGAGTYTFKNVTVNIAKSLNQLVPIEIFVNGDFTNFGTFNPSSHKVTFKGNTEQFISGNMPINLSSMEIDNSFGVTLNQPISIANTFTLTSGNLNTSAANILTMTSTSNVINNSALSFVNGPMKKTGNSSFVFPIGKNGNWRRLGISSPSTISSEVTAEYFDNQAINTSMINSPLNAVSVIENWQLDKSNPSDVLTIELFWEDATQSGISDCAATTIAHYNGNSWENVNSTATGNCTSNGVGSILSNSTQNDLGLFTFGYFGNLVSQSVTICNGSSFMVGANNYTTSGNYIDVLTDVNTNDSMVITNLTVLPILTSSQNIEICPGESFTIGTSTYTISGNYSDVLISTNGCDSAVTTILNVANPIDVSTSVTGILLSASNLTSSAYQWLDCGNGYIPIAGENGPTFLPSVNGTYAVEITMGICKDTSSCIIVNSVNLSEINLLSKISIYPNPSNGRFKIKLPEGLETIEFLLTDYLGRSITSNLLFLKDSDIFDISSYPNGVYYLTSTENHLKITFCIIKQ